MNNKVSVTSEVGQLSIKGEFDAADGWRVTSLPSGEILLRPEATNSDSTGATFGSVEAAILRDLLLSFVRRSWSGAVVIESPDSLKRLYFCHGELVFAASNLIDDRLGEVIYRASMINLSELTNAAGQVTKSRKFGQVLIANGVFNNVDLWRALELQVLQVLRSIFMSESASFSLSPGAAPPTEISFAGRTSTVIDDAFAFGRGFRDFHRRLSEEAMSEFTDFGREADCLKRQGTFAADFSDLVQANPSFGDLLQASKLSREYTTTELWNFVSKGYCQVAQLADDSVPGGSELSRLRSELDAYDVVLREAQKEFRLEEVNFPFNDVAEFAAQLNSGLSAGLFLDREAKFPRQMIWRMMSESKGHETRQAMYIDDLGSLMRFLLHVSGDNLSREAAVRVRDVYRALSQ